MQLIQRLRKEDMPLEWVSQNAKTGKIATAEFRGGLKLDVSALVDDTAAFLAVHEPSFHEFLRLLEVFQSASGAKINFAKSRILLLGKYSRPPDWLSVGPFKVLGRHDPTRYLGIMVASSLKPQDVWAHAIIAVNNRLFGLTDKYLNFEGMCTVLRFHVQTKLSFAISLVTLRNSHQKTLRQLFRTFLRDTSPARKPKVPLVAWDFISAPLCEGGLGIWDLTSFNLAFLVKYVSSLMCKTPDALWPGLFWTLCRDTVRKTHLDFLLFAPTWGRNGGSVALEALRVCWRQRCELQFDDAGKTVSFVSPLISEVEILLAEGRFSSTGKKVIRKAVLLIFPVTFRFPVGFSCPLADIYRMTDDPLLVSLQGLMLAISAPLFCPTWVKGQRSFQHFFSCSDYS
ncbi:hypothetical protein R1sor_026167 [Riccia sorocarpa]|uniref:Reverse transcriptase domain-containing protein n=1 Tax=Riccia sorocarpa TaxID=122646 RepID=A0ABD3GGA9_9MARC